MRKRRLSLAVLLVIAWSALGGRAAPAPAPAPIWFYRAENAAGRVTFFYPSFHLRDARVPRPPMSMLDSVTRLVLEADVVDVKAHPEAVLPYLVGTEARDLTMLFTPEQIRRIRARAACNGLGGAVEKLKMSFIATLLALPCPAGQGDTRSYEETVELAARQRGLAVTGLETGQEEFAALAALPERLFIEQIKEMTLHPDSTDALIDSMIVLYDKGDFDGLYKLMLSDLPKNAADRQLFIGKVLTDRNRHMADRLTQVVEQGHALVIIGALHFPGKGGLVDLMQRQGLRVTRIDGSNGVLR